MALGSRSLYVLDGDVLSTSTPHDVHESRVNPPPSIWLIGLVGIGEQEMIRCGVTCFNDMYFFPEAAAEVAAEIGMRATIGIPVLEFPNKWVGSTDVVGTVHSRSSREMMMMMHGSSTS